MMEEEHSRAAAAAAAEDLVFFITRYYFYNYNIVYSYAVCTEYTAPQHSPVRVSTVI